MNKIKCIIIEDEPLALERVKGYVAKIPFLELVDTFENGVDALFFVKQNPIDLIFLDINIGEFNGIQLAEAFNHQVKIIITTAYPEYAIKGFDLKVTDYLLKPFTLDRFIQAVERVQSEMKVESNPEVLNDSGFIFIKTEYRLERIEIDDILFIEGMRDYRRIHTLQKKIMTLETFKEFEIRLPKNKICRVHKSYMININHIENIERDRVKIKNELIPISETYKADFYGLIQRK